MGSRNARRLVRLAIGVAAIAALPAGAGDPVPDVDVILEQVPGSTLAIEVRPPLSVDGDPIPDVDVILEQIRFDAVQLTASRSVAKGLVPGRLPTGWSMQRDGRTVVLQGPLLEPPARLSLDLGGGDRPDEVDVEVRRGGQTLARRSHLVPRSVPRRQVRGVLSGVVQLPPEVSPGETLALRTLDPSLPAGRWVISGTVSEPFDAAVLRDSGGIKRVNSSDIAEEIALPEPLTLLAAASCDELAPLAALLGAAAADAAVWRAAQGAAPGSALPRVAVVGGPLRTQHDTAKSVIQNIRRTATFSVAPPGGDQDTSSSDATSGAETTAAGFLVARMQVNPPPAKGRPQPEKKPSSAAPAVASWSVEGVGGSRTLAWSQAEPPARGPTEAITVALEMIPVEGGCRFASRRPGELDWARWAAGRQPTRRAESDTVHLVHLPDDLQAGDTISALYVDEFGEPWVDVPAAEGITVVPAAGEIGEPRLESAGESVVAGDLLCLCGRFSPGFVASGASFVATGRGSGSAGQMPGGVAEAVSSSARIAWVRIPDDAAPGEVILSAPGTAGEATTHVLRVHASLDQQNLLRGGSTPLHLEVEGTDQPVVIRLVNRTPSAIRLSGGDEQDAMTSGGAPNQLEREVSGLQAGSFDIEWSLDPAGCPCAGGGVPGTRPSR